MTTATHDFRPGKLGRVGNREWVELGHEGPIATEPIGFGNTPVPFRPDASPDLAAW